ncbi:hypothetical protein LTR66_013129 [Elasticomyces elasticus]|nr:hypothetical protein LTR66_013129 [Elasticomyces elasticus]
MALDTVRFQNFAFGTEAGWSLCLDSFSPMQYWKYRHGYAYSLTRGGFVDGSPYVPLYDRRGECIGSDRLENRAPPPRQAAWQDHRCICCIDSSEFRPPLFLHEAVVVELALTVQYA